MYIVTTSKAFSTTTSISLLFANKSYCLSILVYHEYNITFSQACNFTIDLNELQSILKTEITVTQQYYQKSTDAQYSPIFNFKVDDKVFVKTQFFRTI